MDDKELEVLEKIRQQLQKILVADLGKSKNDLLVFKEFSQKLSEALENLDELKKVFEGKDNKDICEKLSLIQSALEAYGNKEVIVNVDAPPIPPPLVTHETNIVQETEHAEKACKLLYEILEQVKVRPTNEVKILNREAQDAIPVVLTTASRNAFYTAIVQAMASNDHVTITGTVPLPTGASTSANQTSEITQLTDINTKLAAGVPVSATDLDIRNLVFATDKVDVSGSTLASETFTKKTVTCSSSGDNTLHTPAAGKKIRLYFFGYSAGASVTGNLIGLKFTTGGTVFDNQYLVAAGQPYARNLEAGKRYIEGAINEALIANLSAAQTVYVNIEILEI